MTQANIDARVENLNRRFESRGSVIRWHVQNRNGHTCLDRVRVDGGGFGGPGEVAMDHITAGTKREIADFLRGAMLALDDAATH
jgi:hypothetical protein